MKNIIIKILLMLFIAFISNSLIFAEENCESGGWLTKKSDDGSIVV